LEYWQLYIKNISKLDKLDDIETNEYIVFGTDNFDPDLNSSTLYPTLGLEDNIPTQADRYFQVSNNSSAASLTVLVSQDLPLNRKQQLVVEKVLSKALAWGGNTCDGSVNQGSVKRQGNKASAKTRSIGSLYNKNLKLRREGEKNRSRRLLNTGGARVSM
jgi:hypothetical protein